MGDKRVKTKFGYMKCENRKCGAKVVVKVNEKETLSYTCDECDKSAYAKKGTREHADWLSDIERSAPASQPKPGDKPKPGRRSIVDDIL
jgi:hypothetical protein